MADSQFKLQQGHPTIDARIYRSVRIEPGSFFNVNEVGGTAELSIANPPQNTRAVDVYIAKTGDGEQVNDKDLRDLIDFLNSSIMIINRILLDRGREFADNNIHEIDGHIRAIKEKVLWMAQKARENEEADEDE